MTAGRLHPGHMILAALLLAAAVLAWRAVAIALAPIPAPPPFAPPPLADRALLSRVDPFFPSVARTDDSLPVTALPFSLHGVRADSATGRGSAIIATGDGQQMVYAVGDAVSDGVTLAAIAGDHVVLDRGGTREALWLDSGSGQAVQRFDPATAGGAGATAPPPFGTAPGGVPSADPAPSGQAEPDAIDLVPPGGANRAPGPDALPDALPEQGGGQ